MRGDDGVSLVLALLIVTAIAVVTVTMLGQAFTNTAVTITARQVAATQYSADAAAQYVANQVRLSNLTSGLCSSNTVVTSEDLSGLYPAGLTTVAQKAHVDCAPDPANGTSPGNADTFCPPAPAPCPNTAPGTALLTLDSTPTDTGIYVSVSGTPGPIKVRGGIFSNSMIKVVSGELRDTWCPANPPGSTTYVCGQAKPTTYVMARGACPGPGTITFDQTGGSPPPTATCNYPTSNDARGADPGVARTGYTPGASYSAPAAPTGQAYSQSCTAVPANPSSPGAACTVDANPAAACTTAKFQQVLPGRIAGASGLAFLNALTGCSRGIVQFTPGTYYFDLPSVWTLPAKVTVVGGTFSSTYDPVSGSGPGGWPAACTPGNCTADYADACVAPGDAAATTTSGVEFVVGGATQFNVSASANPGSHLTICASNSADGPPIAMYGLKSSIGSGATLVSASNLCAPNGSGSTACAVIVTQNSPKSTVNLVGMTYVPRSTVRIGLNNSSTKLFYWGVVSYAVEFNATGSSTLTSNLVDVQDGWPSPFAPMYRYFLNIFTCAATAASCPASGATPNTTEVVQVGNDTSGNPLPAGNVLVLGWSDNR